MNIHVSGSRLAWRGVAASVACVVVTAGIAAAGELVANGGFELQDGDALAGWKPSHAFADSIPNTTAGVGGAGALYVWDTQSRGTGRGCLKMSLESYFPKPQGLVVSDNIPLKPGTAYHLAVYYRAKGLVSLDAGKMEGKNKVDCPLLVDVFFEKTGKFLGSKRIYIGRDSDDWKLAEVDFTTPAEIEWGTIRISVVSGLASSAATVWVDDVSLTTTATDAPAPAAKSAFQERAPVVKADHSLNDPELLAETQPDLGRRIQRTMKLLATSTPEHRNRVKILFYGQSITAQEWTTILINRLKQQYPNADIVWENRAIGGTTAEYLVDHAETDLFPFYPDLAVFAVYGGVKDGELERIYKGIRERTTAEIITKTHHWAWPGEMAAMKMYRRNDEEGSKVIRELARKYDCELVDVRALQSTVIEKTGKKPGDFLRPGDGIHLGSLGWDLFQRFYLPHFRYLPDQSPTWLDRVKVYTADGKRWPQTGAEYPVGGTLLDKPLKFDFEGNRVDLLAGPVTAAKPGSARILIDGKKPSEFPEIYAATRSGTFGWWWWPVLKRVEIGKHPQVEDWTLVGKLSDGGKTFSYSLTGSKTGADGEGSSAGRFESKSGRLLIDPSWFNCERSAKPGKKTTADFQTKFSVYMQGMDLWQPAPITDKAAEDRTTLAQGLANGKHTLEIIPNGDGPLGLRAIVVYQPSKAEQPASVPVGKSIK